MVGAASHRFKLSHILHHLTSLRSIYTTCKFSAEQAIVILNEIGSNEFGNGGDNGSGLISAEIEMIKGAKVEEVESNLRWKGPSLQIQIHLQEGVPEQHKLDMYTYSFKSECWRTH